MATSLVFPLHESLREEKLLPLSSSELARDREEKRHLLLALMDFELLLLGICMCRMLDDSVLFVIPSWSFVLTDGR